MWHRVTLVKADISKEFVASETSVLTKLTRHHTPQEGTLHEECHFLGSYTVWLCKDRCFREKYYLATYFGCYLLFTFLARRFLLPG
jgi:hypothetical protein